MARDLGELAIDFRRKKLLADLKELAGVGDGITLEDVAGWLRDGYKTRTRPPVMLGIPSGGVIEAEWVSGFFNFLLPTRQPADLTKVVVGNHIADNRNALVEYFLEKTSYDWLVQMDADTVYFGHTDPIAELIQVALQNDALIAFAPVAVKGFPHTPNAYKSVEGADGKFYSRIEEYTLDTIMEVDAMGGAFNVIHREVFERVPRPWYRFEQNGLSEDLFFSRSAREAGFKIIADYRIPTAHLVQRAITTQDFINIRAAAEVSGAFNEKKADVVAKMEENVKAGAHLSPERAAQKEELVAHV